MTEYLHYLHGWPGAYWIRKATYYFDLDRHEFGMFKTKAAALAYIKRETAAFRQLQVVLEYQYTTEATDRSVITAEVRNQMYRQIALVRALIYILGSHS